MASVVEAVIFQVEDIQNVKYGLVEVGKGKESDLRGSLSPMREWSEG